MNKISIILVIFGVNFVSSLPIMTPLLLTPLLKMNRIQEAQNKSKVDSSLFLNIESYSGYFTVNEIHNSNMFFWYFPPISKKVNTPVIVWLQGGPGATSFYGIFTENGPFSVNAEIKLMPNNHSWNADYHLIYFDNPVGTGFSFTTSGYAKNETAVGNDLFEAMFQFYQLFPNLEKAPLFLAGESYAGKYIPAFAYTIYHRCKKCRATALKYYPCQECINLKGLMIGNGTPDPYNQIDYGDYWYQLGLIDDNQRKHEQHLYKQFQELVNQQQWINATEIKFEVIDSFANISSFNNMYNYLFSENQLNKNWTKFIAMNAVRHALHVGNRPFVPHSQQVFVNLIEDYSKSVAPLISELLSHYPIMFYNGQLDLVAPYPLLINFLNNLNFSSSNDYKKAKRIPWYVDGKLAGYIKVAGNLTEVLVRNSGHMVPTDQPSWALNLVKYFTEMYS